jgi:predicted metalloprotease
MRWKGRRQSSNIEDRRSASVGRTSRGGGGLLRLLPAAMHFLGVKCTIVAVPALIAFNYFAGDSFGVG